MDSTSKTFVCRSAPKPFNVTLSSDELVVRDPDAESGGIAARLALVGDLIAEARYSADVADATYRQWRGVETTSLLLADPKSAEWKVKAAIEASGADTYDPATGLASEGFLAHKQSVASFESQHEWLLRFYEALKIKSQMIQVQLRARAGELAAPAATISKPSTSEEIKNAVRAGMARNRED